MRQPVLAHASPRVFRNSLRSVSKEDGKRPRDTGCAKVRSFLEALSQNHLRISRTKLTILGYFEHAPVFEPLNGLQSSAVISTPNVAVAMESSESWCCRPLL